MDACSLCRRKSRPIAFADRQVGLCAACAKVLADAVAHAADVAEEERLAQADDDTQRVSELIHEMTEQVAGLGSDVQGDLALAYEAMGLHQDAVRQAAFCVSHTDGEELHHGALMLLAQFMSTVGVDVVRQRLYVE